MTQQLQVVIGLGKTGLSLVRHLARQGVAVAAVDTREQPPELAVIRKEWPQVELHCGSLDTPLLQQAEVLYVSPVLALATPQIQREIARGVRISGDVDLFLQQAKAPVIAITGSNAKSTVTSLVGLMAEKAGVRVAVGGNIGTPVLDLLSDEIELYVLELSSFQLETISHLQPLAATCLNISADHLDRYSDLQHYTEVKLQVYPRSQWAVINRDDTAAQPLAVTGAQLSFGLSAPGGDNAFGLRDGWLARGSENLLPVSELKIPGLHNRPMHWQRWRWARQPACPWRPCCRRCANLPACRTVVSGSGKFITSTGTTTLRPPISVQRWLPSKDWPAIPASWC